MAQVKIGDVVAESLRDLAKNLCYIPSVLNLLIQKDLLSCNERDEIVTRTKPESTANLSLERLELNEFSLMNPVFYANDYQNTFEDISSESHPKSLLNFDDINMIGEGSFGKVFKAKSRSPRKIVAIKIAREVECHRERQNLTKVNHPNIISYIDSWDEVVNDEINSMDWFKGYRTLYCIQTEWCDGGDLYDWIKLDKDEKSLPDTKRICYQISCGVEYLHNHKDLLLHRDLKPANIFLLHAYAKNNLNLKVKIGDLGLCRGTLQRSKGSRAHKMTIKVGDMSYRAPEMRGGKSEYTMAVDIFAISLIFYELIISTTDHKPEFDNDVIASKWFIDTFPKESYYLQKMLSEDAAKRPTAGQVRLFLFEEWQMENFY